MSEQMHYRLLNEGEIIQEGDEFFGCRGSWELFQLGIGEANHLYLPIRRPYTPFQWIPVEERLPTKEDANENQEVLCQSVGRDTPWVMEYTFPDITLSCVIAWAKIPPYIPTASPEEKEFEAWHSKRCGNPADHKPDLKGAMKDAWMAAKKGGKA